MAQPNVKRTAFAVKKKIFTIKKKMRNASHFLNVESREERSSKRHG